MLFLFLSLVLHSKTINSKLESTYIFSIAVHLFRNLFLKICPLFGQILIMCLKCSRASFSPSSYSKKMALGTRLSQHLQENTFIGVSFSVNIVAYQKRGTRDTGLKTQDPYRGPETRDLHLGPIRGSCIY